MAIKTPEQLKDWLTGQRREVCELIAMRATLRVFPLASAASKFITVSDSQVRMLVLLAARASLTAGVHAKFLSDEVSVAAEKAGEAAEKIAYAVDVAANENENGPGASAPCDVANAAARAAEAATDTHPTATRAYQATMEANNTLSMAEISKDYHDRIFEAAYEDADLSLDELFASPIWENGNEPEWFASAAPDGTRLVNHGSEWSFWREWYQGFLDGKPLNWELQRRVALIPDEDWEKGPEHVAKLIDEIRARFELEKRIEALEAEKLVWKEQARHEVGGNNPPEPLESERIVQEIIWSPIEDLKAETQSDSPNKSRIQTAISKLGAALIAVGKWSFGKLDAAADAFVKSLGGGLGGYCVGWITQNSDKIAEVIRAAQAWLSALT